MSALRFITLDPREISPQENYKLLIGSVLPRPIAFVSSLSPEGVPNLAPFSFFNAVCNNPPTILFCPVRRGTDGSKKDTLLNIEATKEFVVNVVSEDIVMPMNQTAAEYPRGVNEFTESGLTEAPSVIIKPPRVLESPISMECRLNQIVYIGEGGPGSGSIVIGTVVYFHLREDVYENGYVVTEKLKPVARLAGTSYCPVRDIFSLPRPTLPVS